MTHLWQRGCCVSDVARLGSQQYRNIPRRQNTAHLKYAEFHLLLGPQDIKSNESQRAQTKSNPFKKYEIIPRMFASEKACTERPDGNNGKVPLTFTFTHHQCVCPQWGWWLNMSLLCPGSSCIWWAEAQQPCRAGPLPPRSCSSPDLRRSLWWDSLGWDKCNTIHFFTHEAISNIFLKSIVNII